MTEHSVFLTQQELATRWKVSVRTLERWRDARYGPAWTALGGLIRYSFADVRAFETDQRSQGYSGEHETIGNTTE